MNNPVVRVTLELEVPPPASEAEGYALGVLTGWDVTNALKQSLGCRIVHINQRVLLTPAAATAQPEYEVADALPEGPGHVTIGISNVTGVISVYAFYTDASGRRARANYPWSADDGNVLDLVQRVTNEAYAKGALAVSASSTVEFWEEAIA